MLISFRTVPLLQLALCPTSQEHLEIPHKQEAHAAATYWLPRTHTPCWITSARLETAGTNPSCKATWKHLWVMRTVWLTGKKMKAHIHAWHNSPPFVLAYQLHLDQWRDCFLRRERFSAQGEHHCCHIQLKNSFLWQSTLDARKADLRSREKYETLSLLRLLVVHIYYHLKQC